MPQFPPGLPALCCFKSSWIRVSQTKKPPGLLAPEVVKACCFFEDAYKAVPPQPREPVINQPLLVSHVRRLSTTMVSTVPRIAVPIFGCLCRITLVILCFHFLVRCCVNKLSLHYTAKPGLSQQIFSTFFAFFIMRCSYLVFWTIFLSFAQKIGVL